MYVYSFYRYKDFRDSEGQPTTFYWELLCIRLLFVIVFEVKILLLSLYP